MMQAAYWILLGILAALALIWVVGLLCDYLSGRR